MKILNKEIELEKLGKTDIKTKYCKFIVIEI